MQYDRVESDERTRAKADTLAELAERAFDAASATAHIELAKMPDCEISDLIHNDEALTNKLGLLLESVAKLGLKTPHQRDDVAYHAHNLFGAMLDKVAERRIADVRSAQ